MTSVIYTGLYGESVELGDVDLHKKSCYDEKFAPKKGWRTNFWE